MCTTQDNLFLERKYSRRLRVIKISDAAPPTAVLMKGGGCGNAGNVFLATTHDGPRAASGHAPQRHKQGNRFADEIHEPEEGGGVEEPDVDVCEDVVAFSAAIVDFGIVGGVEAFCGVVV